MEKRRRRAQCSAETEPQAERLQLSDDAQTQNEEQPASPRRRRRVQPPQQITQKFSPIVLPDDVQPLTTEATKPEKKRYKKTESIPKNPPIKNEAAIAQRREKQKKVIKACAGAGKTAIEATLNVLLLAVQKLRRGTGRLWTLLKKQIEKHAEQSNEKQGTAEEVVLEAIRPEDYHGRGAQHAAKKDKGHDAQTALALLSANRQRLISAALVLVAAVSLFNIASILWRTFRTTRLNAQLAEQYASMGGNQESENEMQALSVYEEETPAPVPVRTSEPIVQQQMPKPAAKTTPVPDLVKSTKFHHIGGDALPEMEALYNQNRDLVAWLNIPEVIDLPVVYKDNSYYLKRDFNKQKNTAGTIFLDENHPFKEKTQNLLLHGHNMKDGTMFGRLTQYIYDRTYIKNHPFINLSTLWRKEQYVIFAVLDVSLNPKEEAFFNYFTHANFASDAEFTSYIRQLQLRSMFAIPIDVEPTDALLTLSTCLEENRLVIVARRLRPNETRQEMRDRIHTATRQ